SEVAKPFARTAAAAPAESGAAPVLRSPRREAEETEDPFREAWERAERIEADLHRPADPPGEDRISAMARSLADRAGRLERELAPGHNPDPGALTPFRSSRSR